MLSERRQHIILGVFVTLVGLFLALFLCPYLRMLNHEWLCVALFAVLLLVFVYGRVEIPKSRHRTLSDQH